MNIFNFSKLFSLNNEAYFNFSFILLIQINNEIDGKIIYCNIFFLIIVLFIVYIIINCGGNRKKS